MLYHISGKHEIRLPLPQMCTSCSSLPTKEITSRSQASTPTITIPTPSTRTSRLLLHCCLLNTYDDMFFSQKSIISLAVTSLPLSTTSISSNAVI
eukprot:jgi/Botrbrau1/7648/Bobra.0159s0091.1